MGTDVIVLNGASSSAKTTLARSLQATLPDPWLRFGVDTLIDAMPASITSGGAGIGFKADGGGVSCEPEIAAQREAGRSDRIAGMAVSQTAAVHEGVLYDVQVDTSYRSSLECARILAAHI